MPVTLHIHVGVYFDGGRFDDLRPVASEFERVIDKHLEVCDPAGWSAHNYDAIDDYLHEDNGCISMNADVGNLGSPRGVHGWLHRGPARQADRGISHGVPSTGRQLGDEPLGPKP